VVYGQDFHARPAQKRCENPKLAAAAAMGQSWFLAYCHIADRHSTVMQDVATGNFNSLSALMIIPSDDDRVLQTALGVALLKLGKTFHQMFFKLLLQENSPLLLGLATILGHWNLGFSEYVPVRNSYFKHVVCSMGNYERRFCSVLF
jgi:hypothetical protein